MKRATRGVWQHKEWKTETETNLQPAERLDVLTKPKQETKKEWNGDKSTTSRATGRIEQNKARFNIESNVWTLWGRLLLDW